MSRKSGSSSYCSGSSNSSYSSTEEEDEEEEEEEDNDTLKRHSSSSSDDDDDDDDDSASGGSSIQDDNDDDDNDHDQNGTNSDHDNSDGQEEDTITSREPSLPTRNNDVDDYSNSASTDEQASPLSNWGAPSFLSNRRKDSLLATVNSNAWKGNNGTWIGSNASSQSNVGKDVDGPLNNDGMKNISNHRDSNDTTDTTTGGIRNVGKTNNNIITSAASIIAIRRIDPDEYGSDEEKEVEHVGHQSKPPSSLLSSPLRYKYPDHVNKTLITRKEEPTGTADVIDSPMMKKPTEVPDPQHAQKHKITTMWAMKNQQEKDGKGIVPLPLSTSDKFKSSSSLSSTLPSTAQKESIMGMKSTTTTTTTTGRTDQSKSTESNERSSSSIPAKDKLVEVKPMKFSSSLHPPPETPARMTSDDTTSDCDTSGSQLSFTEEQQPGTVPQINSMKEQNIPDVTENKGTPVWSNRKVILRTVGQGGEITSQDPLEGATTGGNRTKQLWPGTIASSTTTKLIHDVSSFGANQSPTSVPYMAATIPSRDGQQVQVGEDEGATNNVDDANNKKGPIKYVPLTTKGAASPEWIAKLASLRTAKKVNEDKSVVSKKKNNLGSLGSSDVTEDKKAVQAWRVQMSNKGDSMGQKQQQPIVADDMLNMLNVQLQLQVAAKGSTADSKATKLNTKGDPTEPTSSSTMPDIATSDDDDRKFESKTTSSVTKKAIPPVEASKTSSNPSWVLARAALRSTAASEPGEKRVHLPSKGSASSSKNEATKKEIRAPNPPVEDGVPPVAESITIGTIGTRSIGKRELPKTALADSPEQNEASTTNSIKQEVLPGRPSPFESNNNTSVPLSPTERNTVIVAATTNRSPWEEKQPAFADGGEVAATPQVDDVVLKPVDEKQMSRPNLLKKPDHHWQTLRSGYLPRVNFGTSVDVAEGSSFVEESTSAPSVVNSSMDKGSVDGGATAASSSCETDVWKVPPPRNEDDGSWVSPIRPLDPVRKEKVKAEVEQIFLQQLAEQRASAALSNLSFQFGDHEGAYAPPADVGSQKRNSNSNGGAISALSSKGKPESNNNNGVEIGGWSMPRTTTTNDGGRKIQADQKDYRYTYITARSGTPDKAPSSYWDKIRTSYFDDDNVPIPTDGAPRRISQVTVGSMAQARTCSSQDSSEDTDNSSWMPPDRQSAGAVQHRGLVLALASGATTRSNKRVGEPAKLEESVFVTSDSEREAPYYANRSRRVDFTGKVTNYVQDTGRDSNDSANSDQFAWVPNPDDISSEEEDDNESDESSDDQDDNNINVRHDGNGEYDYEYDVERSTLFQSHKVEEDTTVSHRNDMHSNASLDAGLYPDSIMNYDEYDDDHDPYEAPLNDEESSPPIRRQQKGQEGPPDPPSVGDEEDGSSLKPSILRSKSMSSESSSNRTGRVSFSPQLERITFRDEPNEERGSHYATRFKRTSSKRNPKPPKPQRSTKNGTLVDTKQNERRLNFILVCTMILIPTIVLTIIFVIFLEPENENVDDGGGG